MARYTGPVCKLCRRENKKLFLKGEKCYSDKCAMNNPKVQAPGQHGARRKKPTEYSIQLREKQKTKRFYGVMERQFRKYFAMADKSMGQTGERLLQILESRLDNVVYRLGYAMSRAEAKQLVCHGHFKVNGQRVDIPSYLVSVGDIITIADKSKESTKIKAVVEANSSRPVVKWLEKDVDNMSGKVVALSSREDIDLEIEEHLIVELYSK